MTKQLKSNQKLAEEAFLQMGNMYCMLKSIEYAAVIEYSAHHLLATCILTVQLLIFDPSCHALSAQL